MSLDIKTEVAEIRKRYSEDPRQKSFNVLVLGEMGSGKTFLLRTVRFPCHIDSFDPGGTKCLRDEIAAGKIIADTRFESEDRMHPSMFQLWKTEFEKRRQGGYFDQIATYCIDSSSTWAEAIMNRILQKAQIAGEAPRWAHDYVPQKIEIQNRLRVCLDLPCDFFLTGHLEQYEDQEDQRIRYRYMTTGKGTIIIPTLFDEVYVMDPKRSSAGVEYRILTKNTGTHTARSRLAKGGMLDIYEEANIKKLLKKAGLPAEDKPLI
jgi:hypothetical protein